MQEGDKICYCSTNFLITLFLVVAQLDWTRRILGIWGQMEKTRTFCTLAPPFGCWPWICGTCGNSFVWLLLGQRSDWNKFYLSWHVNFHPFVLIKLKQLCTVILGMAIYFVIIMPLIITIYWACIKWWILYVDYLTQSTQKLCEVAILSPQMETRKWEPKDLF